MSLSCSSLFWLFLCQFLHYVIQMWKNLLLVSLLLCNREKTWEFIMVTTLGYLIIVACTNSSLRPDSHNFTVTWNVKIDSQLVFLFSKFCPVFVSVLYFYLDHNSIPEMAHWHLPESWFPWILAFTQRYSLTSLRINCVSPVDIHETPMIFTGTFHTVFKRKIFSLVGI